MWVLVLIELLTDNVGASSLGQYDSMASCFEAREQYLVDTANYDGYLPINIQAVCIKKN